MLVNGQAVPLSEYVIPDSEAFMGQLTEGWGYYQRYNRNLPEGIPVTGYRVLYRASNGKLYSPFIYPPKRIEKLIQAGNIEKHEQDISQETGIVHHDRFERGYSYWADRSLAETYMFSFINKMKTIDNRGDSQWVPGRLEIHRFEGTSAGKLRVNNDEGDRAQDIVIDSEALVSVDYDEFTRRK